MDEEAVEGEDTSLTEKLHPEQAGEYPKANDPKIHLYVSKTVIKTTIETQRA